MFSLDRFYKILHVNLVEPINGHSISFYPFGTYEDVIVDYKKYYDVTTDLNLLSYNGQNKHSHLHCYFFDQEPFYDFTFDIFDYHRLDWKFRQLPNQINIIANSEKSTLLDKFIRSNNMYSWYYFFHGFAALDWYRDFQFFTNTSFDKFTKVFISYNNLISKYRSYRLHLGSEIIARDIAKDGYFSLPMQENNVSWKNILADKNSSLSTKAKLEIHNNLKDQQTPFKIDDIIPNGATSANVDFDQLTSALWHVVTETVYFQEKLHLTEKVFKPIVAKRPFLLTAAAGNLAYLKSYGFETFSQWINESYDQETDNYLRIIKIADQLERLCQMPIDDLRAMHEEMKPVLEYNFNHFYTGFREKITHELVDNFEHVLCQINNGRQPGNHSRYHQRFELSKEHFAEVKRILLQ